MKIGILGSAIVARTLGKGLIGLGHDVKLGSREPSKLQDWVSENGGMASAGSLQEAAQFGEIVFICTKGEVAVDVVQQAGSDNFAGKTVIDVTNHFTRGEGGIALAGGPGDSLAERIQKVIPQARVVKAFNTVSCFVMVNPKLEEGTATLTIFGNDQSAKDQTTEIAAAFGWDVVDLGGLNLAYWNEAQALIWCLYGFKTNQWGHAFKLLRK